MSARADPVGDDEDAWVADALARHGAQDGLLVPPGHDCGALPGDANGVVVTTDVLVDGVHFDLATCGPHAAARKALLVNLSDLAAAAAVPLGYVVGAVVPRSLSREHFTALAEGFASVAREWSCPCAGGDTNVADGPLTLAVTALGRPGPLGVVTRAGARPGDRLSVTGPLGGSILGRHLSFTPRIREALALAAARVPRAMMDLSDGLSRDVVRLCRASGVGARLDAGRVPVHDDARTRAASSGRSPLEHALDDGEDFELLVAHAPLDEPTRSALRRENVTLVEVGEVVEARRGLRLVRGAAGSLPLAPRGWDHRTPRPAAPRPADGLR